ncbi:MAG: hypothetical protein MK132_16395 [Lentisphaerales bacterium]|nr:hypothetical protein [Lentisphaerales bacterium]
MTSIFLLSVFRSLIISAMIVLISRQVYQSYSGSHGKRRKVFIFLSLLPLITPPLLPAYTYSSFKINFQTSPYLNELIYGLITAARYMPYTVICLFLLNYSRDNSAHACDKLSPGNKLPLIQRQAPLLLSAILPFLLCLHEYEVASLMRTKHWSIEVFNAHSGGLSQTMWASLTMVATPLTISLVSLAFAFYLKKFCTKLQHTNISNLKSPNNTLSFGLLIFLLSQCIAFPLLVVSYTGLIGFSEVFTSGWMLSEITNSLSFAIIATICTAFLSLYFLSFKSSAVFILFTPGLCGSLVLGLIVLNFFQMPIISGLNHTVIPLTIAYILYAFPLSILLNFIYQQKFQDSSLKTAQLLPQQEKQAILWQIKTLPFIICQFPVFCLLWFELTLNTLLAPSSMPGIFPRLYNLMHYNENEKLSATVAVAVFIPPIILALTLIISRIGIKWTNKFSGN